MSTKTFVLTGGPQSGKTSIMRALKEHFGRKILLVPEVATPLIRDLWPEASPESKHHELWVTTLQRGIFHTQLGLEEISRAKATAEHIPLIGHDRGAFDSAAYLRVSADELANDFGVSKSKLLQSYDLVIHLDTQAHTEPEKFGSETNQARFETAEEALALDERLWKAYADHPHHVRVSASNDIKDKERRVIELVTELLN